MHASLIFSPEGGALGIEALSRGAASVLFVGDRQSTEAIENLAKTKLGDTCAAGSLRFLRRSSGPKNSKSFLADPPYEKTKSGSVSLKGS